MERQTPFARVGRLAAERSLGRQFNEAAFLEFDSSTKARWAVPRATLQRSEARRTDKPSWPLLLPL
jgi:hypothetical protein